MKLVNLKNNFDFFFLRYRNFLLTCGVEFFLLVLAFCFVFFFFWLNGFFVFYFSLFFGVVWNLWINLGESTKKKKFQDFVRMAH